MAVSLRLADRVTVTQTASLSDTVTGRGSPNLYHLHDVTSPGRAFKFKFKPEFLGPGIFSFYASYTSI